MANRRSAIVQYPPVCLSLRNALKDRITNGLLDLWKSLRGNCHATGRQWSAVQLNLITVRQNRDGAFHEFARTWSKHGKSFQRAAMLKIREQASCKSGLKLTWYQTE